MMKKEYITLDEENMTLQDISNGPNWIMWVVVAIFAIMTIILLSGYGANLIAGYNTASKKEKSKYNNKKLSRVVGVGFAVITTILMIMAIGATMLSASMAYIFLAVVIIDCAVMIVLMETICKK